VEAAQVSRTVQEYLKELERENPVTAWEQRPNAQEMVSMTDPDAAWAVKSGPATLGYYDNYLVDTTSQSMQRRHVSARKYWPRNE
jgi:hypothetical protein